MSWFPKKRVSSFALRNFHASNLERIKAKFFQFEDESGQVMIVFLGKRNTKGREDGTRVQTILNDNISKVLSIEGGSDGYIDKLMLLSETEWFKKVEPIDKEGLAYLFRKEDNCNPNLPVMNTGVKRKCSEQIATANKKSLLKNVCQQSLQKIGLTQQKTPVETIFQSNQSQSQSYNQPDEVSFNIGDFLSLTSSIQNDPCHLPSDSITDIDCCEQQPLPLSISTTGVSRSKYALTSSPISMSYSCSPSPVSSPLNSPTSVEDDHVPSAPASSYFYDNDIFILDLLI